MLRLERHPVEVYVAPCMSVKTTVGGGGKNFLRGKCVGEGQRARGLRIFEVILLECSSARYQG